MQPRIWSKILNLVLVAALALSGLPAYATDDNRLWNKWDHNPGPDPSTPEGRAYLDYYAEAPEYAEFSKHLRSDQMFRYSFGLMPFKITSFEPNQIRAVVVGQDATHRAEADGFNGGSGFGGRVNFILRYFGLYKSVAMTNNYESTIFGQAGTRDQMIFKINPDTGKVEILFEKVTDNGAWELSYGEKSLVRQQRHDKFRLFMKQNFKSLDAWFLLGGAAQDGMAVFLKEGGFEVPTKYSADDMRYIRVPIAENVNAGGNAVAASYVDGEGNNLEERLIQESPELKAEYEAILKKMGKKGARAAAEYARNGKVTVDHSDPNMQKLVRKALTLNPERTYELASVPQGVGLHGSGILDPAQIGGHKITEATLDGKRTNSLKGYRFPDGSVWPRETAFGPSPHPTALSMMTDAEASKTIERSFQGWRRLLAQGWNITPDVDMDGRPLESRFLKGLSPGWGKNESGPAAFPFGTPADRRSISADAFRMSRQPGVIISGTRDTKVQFDMNEIQKVLAARPVEALPENENWRAPPQGEEFRYNKYRGPGVELAKALVEGIDFDKLFERKPGMTFEKNGIAAYYTGSHPDMEIFGMERGNFNTARAAIVSDPMDISDWKSSVAMTGKRGQFQQGLMNNLGFGENIAILKTVPVDMDGKDASDWSHVLKHTRGYRVAGIQAMIANPNLEVIFVDGPNAKVETLSILKELGRENIPVVEIERTSNDASDMKKAGELAKQLLPNLSKAKVTGKMAIIPRAHLYWHEKWWVGVAGDCVVRSSDKTRGKVIAVIIPDVIRKQPYVATPSVAASLRALIEKANGFGIRLAQKGKDYVLDLRGKGINLNLIDQVRQEFGGKFNKDTTPAKDNVRSIKDAVASKLKGMPISNSVSVPTSQPVKQPVTKPAVISIPTRGGQCLRTFAK